MNKNKITSMILVSTMLSQTIPVVNAQEVTTTDISLDVNATDVENTDTNINDNQSDSIVEDINTNKDDITVEDSVSNIETEIDSEIAADDSDLNIESEGDTTSDEIINESDVTDSDSADYNKDITEEPTEEVIIENNAVETIDNENTRTVDSAIVKDNVYEITLSDGQFIPDLSTVPSTCDTITVITTGDKKLVADDYKKLKESNKPHIDLSQSKSDSIPEGAFQWSTHLKSFKFPKGITAIGYEAFRGCSGLTGTLTIPNTVVSIGDSAFLGCSGFTGDLIIPDSVTTIGNDAFLSCFGFDGNLILSNSLTTIGSFAFSRYQEQFRPMNFTGNLIIPDSVKSIGDYAFFACSQFTGDLIIPDSVTSIGESAFKGCSGFNGDLVLSKSLTTIPSQAFMGSEGFTGDLIIPDSITTIGDSAFSYCSGFNGRLQLPSSLVSIDGSAFDGCSGFTGDLVIPDSVATIEYNAFYGCSGLNGAVLLSDSLNYLGSSAFSRCDSIDKFVMRVDDSYSGSNYRKSIYDVLPDKSKVKVEVPADFDVTNTWINDIDSNNLQRPILNIENLTPDRLHVLSTSLYIPNDYSENDLVVLKDGESYPLPSKDSNGKHIFNESGEYSIALKTLLGTTYDFNFTIAELVNKPTILFQNDKISIIDNGNLLGASTDKVEYRINNSNWETYTNSFRIPDKFVNGIDDIKIEARTTAGGEVSKISEISVSIKKATLEAENVTITQGDKFDALNYVKAIDVDGRDISKKVTTIKDDVKTEVPGNYTVIYKVQANNGYYTEKEIKVTVLKKKLPPVINADNITLNQGSKFNPLDFITVTDNEGNSIDKSKVEVVENTVNTAKSGKYVVTYKIKDDNGLVTTKTVDVIVKEVSSNNNGSGSNQNKIPNAGGNVSLLYLSSIMSIIGGCFFTGKKKKKH